MSHIVQDEVAQITQKIGIKNPNELFHTDAIDKQIHMIIQGNNKTDCWNIYSNKIQSQTNLEESLSKLSTPITTEQNSVGKEFDDFNVRKKVARVLEKMSRFKG